eukprot:scaffold16868_cov60-Phaeocystis_antarctica.AAC.2
MQHVTARSLALSTSEGSPPARSRLASPSMNSSGTSSSTRRVATLATSRGGIEGRSSSSSEPPSVSRGRCSSASAASYRSTASLRSPRL